MKLSGKHPGRESMLKAIQSGKVPFQAHLKSCQACRELFACLTEFPMAGRSTLEEPSQDAMAAYEAIPMLHVPEPSKRRKIKGIAFDSWADRPRLEVRQAAAGLTRRICLEAGNISLEIVAEKRQGGWDFVARVYRDTEAATEFTLRIGGKKLLPRSQGFFHWSSPRAPRAIVLLSPSQRIDFEGLTWR